jgi:hypothetical protein
MFIKTYTYRILPDKIKEFLALQREANAFYRERVDFNVEYLESDRIPGEIVEIQYFADRQTCEKAKRELEADPRSLELERRFETMLDPHAPPVREEEFEQLDMQA